MASGNAIGQGISSAVSSFMSSLPGIIQQYNAGVRQKKGKSILDEFDEQEKDRQALTAQGAKTPGQHQEGSLTSSTPSFSPGTDTPAKTPRDVAINPYDAGDPRLDANQRKQLDDELSGSAVGALSGKGQVKSVAVNRNQDPVLNNQRKIAWESSIIVQESGKHGYKAPRGIMTKHGQALGRYGIMPKFWFKSIGLDPNSEADKIKFENSPELQDKAFRNVVDKYWDGDPLASSRRYYSGSGKPSDTIPKNQPGMPSPNQYADSVVSRMGDLGAANFIKTDQPAKDLATSQVRREGALTHVESMTSASEAFDELLGGIEKGRPKGGPTRAQRKLNYFYENASPEVIKAMEPQIKKIEKMSDNQKEAYASKLSQWNKDADRKVRVAMGRATLEANTAMKKATLDARIKNNARAQEKHQLKLVSQNIRDQIDNFDRIMKDSIKGGSKFKKQHPNIFSQTTKDVGEFGPFDFNPFDKKEWVVNNSAKIQLEQNLKDINAKILRLEGIDVGLDQGSIPTSGGAPGGPKRNLSRFMSPVN